MFFSVFSQEKWLYFLDIIIEINNNFSYIIRAKG
ncbi:uncharacterized protein METZ01_LOCUS473288 [marine metagenome]|uniref:Uncharacterized protein n=1 Tax=marine metagenome TaxID=408172 RepID=A0A383BKL5_9ZZZZ